MDELTPELLLHIYAAGIFPMAENRDDPRLYWIDPDWRSIIPLKGFHVPRRLRRKLRRNPFEVRADTAFHEVVRRCAESTARRPSTWINDRIISLYTELHGMGYAHSVECWQSDALVGGLYGMALGGAFFGESMFTQVTDASKVALVHLVARLAAGGYMLLDTQFLTRHLQQFGAIEIPRAEYHSRLREALKVDAVFYSELGAREVGAALQSITQTS